MDGGRERVVAAFRNRYGRDPDVVANAGGRVNLIGEHTDYHEGFVFPLAIDLRTWAAGARTAGMSVSIWSENLESSAWREIADIAPPGAGESAWLGRPAPQWESYCLGPLWALSRHDVGLPGMDILVWGEVPFGGGLSSSASVEVAVTGLALAIAGEERDAIEVAAIARQAENGYCGVPCGPMDQIASACGREGAALLIDCRTLTLEHVAFPREWAVVVADSGIRHSVAGVEYARRQRECASGLAKVREVFPDIRTARDLAPEVLGEFRGRLSEIEFRRLRHVIAENARTLAARDALAKGDPTLIGRLLYSSHESLATDYEVSCRELDLLVDCASAIGGVIGARLTGAGFGGNTVNLVEAGRAEAFRTGMIEAIGRRTGRIPAVTMVRPSEGLVVEG